MILRFFILSLILIPISGCNDHHKSETARQNTNTRAKNVTEVINVSEREGKVPNFTWRDHAGNLVDFDAYRGKVTLVNFWATWCIPCKKELPILVSLSKELADKNVKVIGISTDRGVNAIADVSSFIQKHNIPYQIIISNNELEEAFGNIRAIPTSFLVDIDGLIVQKILGSRSKEMFIQLITPLLK